MEAQFYEIADKMAVRCTLCPHRCLIQPGKSGLCRVRLNQQGRLSLPFYGRLSALAVDPIEKKPLYHFYPGRQILSVGFWGCNFHCPFCQNHRISQQTSGDFEYLTPQQLVDLTCSHNSFAIAYTYSEPLIHFEYVLETARLARARGLKNVLVSNGFINPEPAAALLEYIDAANIDLKSFNPGFYSREIGGKLEEVKRFLHQAAGKISLEVTTLVIPGKNDTCAEIAALAGFLADLGPEIPLHLSCYYPTYKYTIPPTTDDAVFKLAAEAGKYLRYVYPGNVGKREVNTCCPQCGQVLITRTGYHTRLPGLAGSCCSRCGTAVPVVN